MRQLFFFLAISILSFETTNAQIKELYATISKDNPDQYYIVDQEGDSTLITKFGKKKRPSIADYKFQVLPGKGRVKDEMGTREKHKMYLVNKLGDTLLTVRKKSDKIEFADGTYLTKVQTEDGWNFVDADNNLVYELVLLWNHSQWKYNIKFYEDHQNIDNLNNYVSVALSDMARHKSYDPSEDESDFWFTMWIASL